MQKSTLAVLSGSVSLLAVMFALAGCGPDDPPPPPPPPPPPIKKTPKAIGPVDYDAELATATISGKVVWGENIPEPVAYNMASSHVCGAAGSKPKFQETTVVHPKSKGIRWAVVYVHEGHERFKFNESEKTHTVRQAGCIFLPHTLAIRLGDAVTFTSEDAEPHTVRLSSKKLQPYQVSMRQGQTRTYKAEHAQSSGAYFKCDTHTWMRCNFHVYEHPFFAVTAEDGSFQIKVPPGKYELSAFQQNQKSRGRWKWAPDKKAVVVTAEANKKATVTFTYTRKR